MNPVDPALDEPALGGPPPLVAPADVGGSGPVTAPLPTPRTTRATAPAPGRTSLTLEPDPAARRPAAGALPTARRTEPTPPRSGITPPTPPAPRRRLFGLIPLPARANRAPDPLPATARPVASAAARSRTGEAVGEGEIVESPDLALERKLRTEIQANLGDRLRELDVRVNDRDIAIRARVSRFWQRRSIQRSIESLPMLRGYRARVYVE